MSLTLSAYQPNPLPSSPTRSTGGILLNANCEGCSPSAQSYRRHHHSPHPPRSISPASSTATSSSEDSTGHSQSPKRRTITFAPLPNPRALEFDDQSPLDVNGIPLIVLHGDEDDNRIRDTLPSLDLDDEASPSTSPSAHSPRLSSAKKLSSWSTKKLLRPFKSSSSNNNDSSDASNNNGGLGLFRASSRDSTASSQGTLTDNASSPIKRRMSTGSSPYSLGPTNHIINPKDAHLALAPTLSENGGGVKMLNGRVYGGSRLRSGSRSSAASAPNPTTTAEPEFVEWGYGGTGSNSAHTASSKYAKLQSGQKNVVAPAEDEDDGSGMGWVRKRREQREQEKKEREDKEKAERQHEEEVVDAASSSVDTLPDPLDVEKVSSTPPVASSSSSSPAPEHVTKAITVPVRQSSSSGHHHHRPQRSFGSSGLPRTDSADSTSTITPATSSRTLPGPSNLHVQTSAAELEDESESSSEEDLSEGSTEKEDDEEEVEDLAEIRKTSACAGVEKISRHKE